VQWSRPPPAACGLLWELAAGGDDPLGELALAIWRSPPSPHDPQLRGMRWAGVARVVAVAVAAAAATVLAEDVPPSDTGSTLEASSVPQSAGGTTHGNSSSVGREASWRGAGFGESPGQMVTMVLAISFTTALAIAWVCCRVLGVGGESKPVCTRATQRTSFTRQRLSQTRVLAACCCTQDPETHVPELTGAIMAVVDSNSPPDEKEEEIRKLVRQAVECGMHCAP
jgi:hypothetical protein